MAQGVQRIRVVSHPPLPPLKAWLPIPTADETVAQLASAVSAMLGGAQIELELMGFALIPNSPCVILDPANDILDAKLSTPASLPLSLPTLFPPPLPSAPLPKPPAAPVAAKPPQETDSDSSDSDSSDNSDDDGPEVQGTTSSHPGPVSHTPPAPQLPPAKRARLTTATSTAGKSSSSSSDSSSSSSSSDDSDSLDDSDEGATPAAAAAKPVARTNGIASTSSTTAPPAPDSSTTHLPVPPGKGLKRTQLRNARKRALKAFRAAPSSSSSATVAPTPPPPGVKGTTTLASSYIPPPPKVKTKALPLDPYYDLAGPKLDMLHLASGNKNKKKFIVGVGRDGKAKGRVATRTVFGKEEEGGEGLEEKTMEEEQPRGATKEGSPSWTPGSPPAVGNEGVQSVAGNAGVEQGVEKVVAVAPKGKGKGGKKEQQKREWKPQGGLGTPSERRDLPPNVVVTKVNVERDGWVAGAGPVVEGTSSTWVQTPWVRQAVLDLGWAKEVAVEQELKEIEWEGEWKGWPGVESVEKSWDSLAVLSVADGASRVGAKVVTKVLELDPTTFSPTLALKFGVLQPPTDPSLPLSIRLHPACVPPPPEEEHYEDDEEIDAGAVRPKFGQPVDDEADLGDGAGVFEGQWGDIRVLV